jgi:hypothetical protein
MVLAAQNAQLTGNKNVVEVGIEPARMSDYLIRLHYDPTPAVSNRLYTARYEYRASVYKRLRGPRTCLWQFLLQLSSWFAAVGSGIWRAKCGMKKILFLHLVNPIPSGVGEPINYQIQTRAVVWHHDSLQTASYKRSRQSIRPSSRANCLSECEGPISLFTDL